MYSTCLFCHRPLGSNEVVETFPIGRRLAFDAERGRLWVVCTYCERWNLTPLEERWEAVEVCERIFRDSRLRASTEHVGLARVSEGLTLIRIGSPLRPELAAWRYGDQFGRRRRRMLIRSGAGLAVVGGLLAGGVALGFASFIGPALLWEIVRDATVGHPTEVVAILPRDMGESLRIRRKTLSEIRLVWEQDRRDWALEVPTGRTRMATMRGPEAMRAVALLLPAVNRFGGSDRLTRDAVALLEHHGQPDALFRALASEWDGTASGYRDLPGGRIEFSGEGPRGHLPQLAPVHRLALEMASHENAERRALDGELGELERAWREAEEIAAIADDLLLPAGVRSFLERNRKRE